MGRGPTALLEQHGLEERLSSASFDVAVDTVEIPDALGTGDRAHVRAQPPVGALGRGPHVPRVLFRSSSAATATAPGARRPECVDDEAPAVLWLDAHADFDVPDDNLSGFLDVMALSTLTGACWQALAATIPGFKPVPERNVLLAGARDLDDYQRERLEQSEISGHGEPLTPSSRPSTPSPRPCTCTSIWTASTSSVGQANEFSAPDGLALERVLVLQREAVEAFDVSCASVTAYNPDFDADGRMAAAAAEIVLGVAAIGTGEEA